MLLIIFLNYTLIKLKPRVHNIVQNVHVHRYDNRPTVFSRYSAVLVAFHPLKIITNKYMLN